MIGYIFHHRRRYNAPVTPLTPEEIRENENIEISMWATIITTLLIITGLCALIIGGVWGTVIGITLVVSGILSILGSIVAP